MPISLLVADDDELFRKHTIRYYETERKWNVKGAVNGTEAWNLLEAESFDALLLDRKMPGLDGDEVMRRIHEDPRLQNLCVIICTANPLTASAIDALTGGAWRYVEKPIADYKTLDALLMPGIALKRCHQKRSGLFRSATLNALFHDLDEVCSQPDKSARLHLLFVDGSGTIFGYDGTPTGGPRRRFMNEVIETGRHLFVDTAAASRQWEPIREDSATLLAVPVPSPENGGVIGAVVMESRQEMAFSIAWLEVLRYVADLVGLYKANEKRLELSTAVTIYRELRHRVATHAQVIFLQSEELKEDPANELHRRLEIIARNSATINSIVNDLREATNTDMTRKFPKELRAVLNEALEHLPSEQDAFPNIGPLPDVKITCNDSLVYALSCVLRNAGEAIGARRQFDPEAPEALGIRVTAALDEQSRLVQIEISDDGVGLDPEIDETEKVFQILYSRKARTASPGPASDRGVERLQRILMSLAETVNVDKELATAIQGKHAFRISIEDGAKLTLSLYGIDHQVTVLNLSEVTPNRGVGLFSARRIVEDHGGRIWAKSDGLNKGATFTIELPLC
jgi:CheY-like chemotaxis protein